MPLSITSKSKAVDVSGYVITTILQLTTLVIGTLLVSCTFSPGKIKNHITSNDTLSTGSRLQHRVDTPGSFVRNYGVNDNTKLFAFVGQKISIKPLPSRRSSFDNCFKAKYLILQKVYGDFPVDTIEFIVYDHYGTPTFSEFKNVLLYVSADSGIYFHQKYMYNDVYKTKDGRWAGTYSLEDYRHPRNKQTKVKPIKIDFAETVSYPLVMINDEGDTLTRRLPRPYFKTIGDTAFAVYGNYVEDLFILKRDGYLTAREIFKDGMLTK